MTEEKESKTKKTKKLPVEVNKEELTDLLPKVKTFHHRLGIALAWYCGLRISDVTNLQPININEADNRINIIDGKGGKDRVVPLPDWWLPGPKGHAQFLPVPCGVRSMQKAFENGTKKSGLKDKKPTVHFHSLRHGFVTHCLRQGMSIYNVAMLAGHASINTTQIYNRISPDEALEEYRTKCEG